jgi:hypothetical protein
MSTSLPSQILIVRHGEKLGTASSDKNGGPDLSMQGSARAAALPSLFAPATPPLGCDLATATSSFTGTYKAVKISGSKPRFSTPDFIFATQTSAHSNRPIETITPTATALSLSIDNSYPDSSTGIQELVNAINSGSQYAGKVVLICWHHGNIPALAKALGISKPPKWNGTVFDRVWEITYSKKGKAALKNHPQKLLYGDSSK